MHTTKSIKSNDFNIAINERPASLEDVFPDFNKNDRIGIIVQRAGGSMGGSSLFMAAMARFYDFYRDENKDITPSNLRIYPEYFIFHVGKNHMKHALIDVWPPHREVVVEDDPEQILEAINDRGITRLLVEDMSPTTPTLMEETINSAKLRIISALAYSPTGRVENADVEIKSCAVAERFLLAALNGSEEIHEEDKKKLRKVRKRLLIDERATETYRQILPTDALHMLTESTVPGHATSRYMARVKAVTKST